MKSLVISQILLTIAMLTSRASPCYEKPDSVYLVMQPNVDRSVAPHPVEGWDAFKSRFIYPEKARRLRLACAMDVDASLDSLGVVQSIQAFGSNVDSVFLGSVEKALISTAWAPVSRRSTKVVFQIAFMPKLQNQPLAILVQVAPIVVNVWNYIGSARDTGFVYLGAAIISDSVYRITNAPEPVHPDKITSPFPIAGWDSLLTTFSLLRVGRSGRNSFVLVHIRFNSAGSIVEFSAEPKDPEFRQFLEVTFKSVAWSAATKIGRPIGAKLSIPIFSFGRGYDSAHRLIIVCN